MNTAETLGEKVVNYLNIRMPYSRGPAIIYIDSLWHRINNISVFKGCLITFGIIISPYVFFYRVFTFRYVFTNGDYNLPFYLDLLGILLCLVVFYLVYKILAINKLMPASKLNHPAITPIKLPSNIERLYLTDDDLLREEEIKEREQEEVSKQIIQKDEELSMLYRILSSVNPELTDQFMEKEQVLLDTMEEVENSKREKDRIEILDIINRRQSGGEDDGNPMDVTDSNVLSKIN